MKYIKKQLMEIVQWGIVSSLGIKMLVGIANAQNQQSIPTIITNKDNLQTAIWCPIITTFFWILIALSVIMALWAAFNYITASDDTEKTTKARRLLLYAAIGVVVALIANGFPALVGSMFTSGSSSFVECPSVL